MPNLDSLLSFPTNGAGPSSAAERTPIPPISSHILVTDTTDSPALFVLTHFLRASHAINRLQRTATASANSDRKGKARAHNKVIWMGCNSDGIVHLKNVARKSGVYLDEEVRQGTFCFVDANAEMLASSADDAVTSSMAAMNIQHDQPHAKKALRRLHGKVKEALQDTSLDNDEQVDRTNWASKNIVIIDDLTALAWALDPSDSFGQSIDVAQHLSDWIRALSALAAKVSTLNTAAFITAASSALTDTPKLSLFDNDNDRIRQASSP